ncbi:MAG: hypothetical protein M0036_20780 [Desulfobacteraceae bacterium]|nr:hypothetical protein [Desulfobacteraceae bacterium]
MDEEVKVSLTTIKGGAAVEMFDRCLDQVLENIADINTDTKARQIVLTVTIAPTEDRGMASIVLTCAAKTRSQDRVMTTALLKRGSLFENRPKQMPIFDNVTPIKKGAEAND